MQINKQIKQTISNKQTTHIINKQNKQTYETNKTNKHTQQKEREDYQQSLS